jgi:hypothetical protein
MINNFSNTRSDFWKIRCIRHSHMKAPELKAAGHDLAAAVGITASSLARPARADRGVSEHIANLVRLIEGGVDVEAFAHKKRGRRDRAAKRTKSSNAAHSKSKGRQRARKGSI